MLNVLFSNKWHAFYKILCLHACHPFVDPVGENIKLSMKKRFCVDEVAHYCLQVHHLIHFSPSLLPASSSPLTLHAYEPINLWHFCGRFLELPGSSLLVVRALKDQLAALRNGSISDGEKIKPINQSDHKPNQSRFNDAFRQNYLNISLYHNTVQYKQQYFSVIGIDRTCSRT